MVKHSFHPDGKDTIEIDLYAQAKNGPDLVIEVKDWEGKVSKDRVQDFIKAKNLLSETLDPETRFLFYSEQPIADNNIDHLQKAGIIYADKNSFTW